jgi:hypothetical protein
MPKNSKGDVRDPLSVERTRLGLLETGWKRMFIRHAEEIIEQQKKIQESRERLVKLEAEKEAK